MAVLVRVKNFQSIEDSEVIIDGLTVVTGTNNSGKTALMRAVRGVFTNPSAAPLVRHGAAYLSVTLSFDDGTTICWEKGWEKPGQKGKGVNRYHINGITIQGVGRGVPPEVELLGVRDIAASSERVWPQIADQFDGTLFLLNRPGSAVAEALSDVDKVGRLTDALKLSEKDQRAADNELKVRRSDVDLFKKEVSLYAGLDTTAASIRDLQGGKVRVQSAFTMAGEAQALGIRIQSARRAVQDLSGFNPAIPPLGKGAEVAAQLASLRPLRSRYHASRDASILYVGFNLRPPAEGKADSIRQTLADLRRMSSRLKAARGAHSGLQNAPSPQFPDPARVQKLQVALHVVGQFRERRKEAVKSLSSISSQETQVARELEEATQEVRALLGDRGVCPTCDTVHTATESHRRTQ